MFQALASCRALAMSSVWVDLSPPRSSRTTCCCAARQVDPVSGAEGETQLQDAATDRFRIAEVAGAQTIETGQDPQTALPVLQPTQPTIEVLGGENLEHVSIIVDRGDSGQSSPRGPLRGRSGREGRSCAA